MICAVCKRSSDEVRLFDGILDDEMVHLCENCAKNENVPLIKRPSDEQLERMDKRVSVRERMEQLSGPKRSQISEEQMFIQGRIAKLRVPERKQYNESVLDNYYWTVSMARKRRKISSKQLAEKMGVEESVIRSIERGKIPENFEEIFIKLEAYLGIKLLKNPSKKIHFIRTKEDEEKILRRVGRRMNGEIDEEDMEEDEEEKTVENDFDESAERKFQPIYKRRPLDREKMNNIYKGEFDFSKRENLQNVTLNDLVEMKRQREKREAKRRERLQEETFLGEDLDLDE